jgi:tetratricopeptide (TPR) repeat protein
MPTRKYQDMLTGMIEKAFFLQRHNRHEEAIVLFQKIIEHEPTNSDAHHYLGVSYMALDNLNVAIPAMEKSIHLSPEFDDYYCNIGLAFWRIKKEKTAIDYFKHGMSINPNNKYIQLNLIQLLRDMGKLEEALFECQNIMERHPEDYTVFLILIMLEICLCQKNLVRSSINKILIDNNFQRDKWLDNIPENDSKYLFIKGVLFIESDKRAQGYDYLQKAEQIDPGAGWIFTYKTLSKMKWYYPIILLPNNHKKHLSESNYDGTITMNNLGLYGRFGHQIQYYLGIKLYAKRHNLYLEISDWVGRYFFKGCNDPFISTVLESIDSTEPSFTCSIDGISPPPKKKFNLQGSCFQFPKTLEEKRAIQQILTPLNYWTKKLDNELNHLKFGKKTLLTIHMRRGDFIKDGRFVPSSQLYLKWLEAIWPVLDNPVLYIASDEIESVKTDFCKYNPVIREDINLQFYFDDFFTDFYVISQSDIVVIGQSSFSRIAALCNKKCSQFFWVNEKTQLIEPLHLFSIG